MTVLTVSSGWPNPHSPQPMPGTRSLTPSNSVSVTHSVFLALILRIPYFYFQISINWPERVIEKQKCMCRRFLKFSCDLPIAVVWDSGRWKGLRPEIILSEYSSIVVDSILYFHVVCLLVLMQSF